MKYICLGYINEKDWESATESEQQAMMDKNIPDSIYKKLKQQVEAQHRSMNSEIIACLERSVEPNRVSDDEIFRQARIMRKK